MSHAHLRRACPHLHGCGCKHLTLLPQQRGEQRSKNYGHASFLPSVGLRMSTFAPSDSRACHLPFSSFLSHALPTKVDIVKAMGFPVVKCRCESWIIKKTECRKIDAFELWCWRRLLRDPWTARSSNQSILKEINPEYSLEGLMLKLKLWFEELTHWKRPWCWERLRAEEKGVAEDEMVEWHQWLNGHEFEQTPGDGEGEGSLACCSPGGRKELDTTEQLKNNFWPYICECLHLWLHNTGFWYIIKRMLLQLPQMWAMKR